MKLITQRELILGIAKWWKGRFGLPRTKSNTIAESYWNEKHSGGDGILRTKQQILDELERLDLNTTSPEDVERFTRKGNLVRIFCNECYNETTSALKLECDENDIYICKKCYEEAAALWPK